jgi:hypothetical protein
MQQRKQRATGRVVATRTKKGKKKRGAGRRKAQSEERSLFNSNMLRPRGVLLAAELVQPMAVSFTIGGGTAGAVAFVDTVLKINSLADAAWAGSIPALNTFNELYSSYRIIGLQMSLEAGSRHTANVNAGYLFTTTSSAVTTAAGALLAAANGYGTSRLLSAATGGKPVTTMRRKVWLADVVGTDSVETDADYAAATNAVADPSSLIYLHLMSSTQSGNFAASGDCAFTLQVTWIVKFFNRVRVIS